MKKLRAILVWTVLALWLAWTALTLLFSNFSSELLRQGLAGGYVLVLIGALFLKPRKRRVTALLLLGALVSVTYFAQRPSNDRDWIPEVAVAATAEIDGDAVTIRGVRNFRYRSETDFDEVWEDREYDLTKLRSLDLFMSYWGPLDYCHTILSFGFEGGEQLAASVEVRKEKGEVFSTYGGFFKMFEVSYLFADERDVIGVRTDQRGEDVYLYRLRTDPERLRDLFLSYVRFADELSREPQYYDVLENSCGVNILHRIGDTGLDVGWAGTDALFNGYWDRLLYERGAIHQEMPLEELRAKSRINARARAAGAASDFSIQLRAGLPAAPTWSTSGDAERDAKTSGS